MPKRRLRLIVLIAVLLMGTAVTMAQETVHLRMLGWGGSEEEAVYRALIEAFNAQNPRIEVEFERSSDLMADLEAGLAEGNPPDIIFVPDYEFPALMARGVLVNLQERVDRSLLFNPSEIWSSALDRYRFDSAAGAFGQGDLYVLPKDVGPMVLYINEDMFAQAGVPLPDPTVPMTWDELVETATLLTLDEQGRHPNEQGFDPTSIQQYGLAEFQWEVAVYGNGGRIVSEDGRTFLAAQDANTLEALDWLAALRNLYHVAPVDVEQPTALFEAGIAAMTTHGRWQVPYYRLALPFEWDVRPNPVGPSGELTTAGSAAACRFSGWSSSTGLGIVAGSQGEAHLDEAFRFIGFLAGAPAQAELARLGFAVPNQIEVANSAALQPAEQPENQQVFLEAARCQVSPPWTHSPAYGEWFDGLFWDGVWQDVVISDSGSAQAAFARRADAFQQALDEAWTRFEEGGESQ